MSKKPVKYEKSLIQAAEMLSKAFREISKKIHKENNIEISHEEYLILETIYFHPGIIQIDIAKNILMKRSYVCKFLAKLEENGYIYRENAIRGKRQIIMKNFITEKGQKIYQKVAEIYLHNQSESVVSEQEWEELDKATKLIFDVTEKAKKYYNLKF